MPVPRLLFAVVVVTLVHQARSQNGGPMVDMLDAMQQLMTGDLQYFDPEFLDRLGKCWDSTHPDLRQSQDNAWQVEFTLTVLLDNLSQLESA